MTFQTEATFQADAFLDSKSQITETADGSLLIEGLASDWGLDDQDELFEPGAFDAGIKSFLETNPLLAYHHDGGKPLGQVLDLQPNEQGLWMKAKIDPPAEGSWAEDVVAKIKTGTIRGLSVAGKFRRRIGADGTPRIYEAGLREISVTPLPVNPRTMFTVAQKAFEETSDDPTAEKLDALQGSINRLEAVFGTVEAALDNRQS